MGEGGQDRGLLGLDRIDRVEGLGSISIDGRLARCIAWLRTPGRSHPRGPARSPPLRNPPCCNPAHLFVGRRFDNMRDAHRGRATWATRGEEPPAQLTTEQVAEIRGRYTPGVPDPRRCAVSQDREGARISPKTVGTHIQLILSKLDVHSRTEAVALAYREGLTKAGAPSRSHR